jgi:hypothetical protein
MMNVYVVRSCLFQRIQLINPATGDIIPGSERGYGFLSRETDHDMKPDYGQCSWYTLEEYNTIFDAWMDSGRFFAFLSAFLATICFLVMFLTCCMAFSSNMFERWLFWTHIAAAITIAFSFLIFGSDHCGEHECKVADGCGYAISAFMFHLLSANTVKSFAAASPPDSNRNNDNDEGDDDIDDDLDDLYYENEEDKYPPPRPEGPRGVIIKKNGQKEFDNGEDYYDDFGRMIDPNDGRGAYKEAKKEEDDDDLRDIENIDDDDLEGYNSEEFMSDEEGEYDSDEEARKTKKKHDQERQRQYDEFGNPIPYFPAEDQNGSLGVGYEHEEEGLNNPHYDDFGNPILGEYRNQQQDEFGTPTRVFFEDSNDGNLGVGYENDNAEDDVFRNHKVPNNNGSRDPPSASDGYQYDGFGDPNNGHLGVHSEQIQGKKNNPYNNYTNGQEPDEDGGPTFA